MPTPNQAPAPEHTPYKLPLSISYDNDTGPSDEGFSEWWYVYDAEGECLAECDTEQKANAIKTSLEAIPAAVEALEEVISKYEIARDLRWRALGLPVPKDDKDAPQIVKARAALRALKPE